jgi:serine/threonine protein kinase
VTVEGVQQKRDFMNLEYCQRGDLYEFIKQYLDSQEQKGHQYKGLMMKDMGLLKSMFLQLIDAVAAMHNKAGYAHMDIKLDNILISNEGNLKLCDFGLSTNATSMISKKLGTEAYMAPEIHFARTTPCLAKSTDIFSLGILFFIMTFGAPPFHSAQP